MADLAASDITVTLQALASGRKSSIENGRRRTLAKLAFGNGTLTYPTDGVPLPGYASFGMVRSLSHVTIVDQDDAQGIIWKYDFENKKLRAYIQGVTVAAAGAATLDDFPLDTTAEPLATTVSVSLTNNTGAGAKYLGRLVELVNTQAPAATVLYVEASGW
jgi:hypothetical protein